jgi:hypothetical protein
VRRRHNGKTEVGGKVAFAVDDKANCEKCLKCYAATTGRGHWPGGGHDGPGRGALVRGDGAGLARKRAGSQPSGRGALEAAAKVEAVIAALRTLTGIPDNYQLRVGITPLRNAHWFG